MRPAWLSFCAFASVLGPRSILGQSITPGIVPGTVPCNNDLNEEIRFNVPEQGITISRRCWWVASNQEVCALVDVNEDVLVAVTCANQCPKLSGCPFVAPPTPSPTPIPTLSPTKLPTLSPTKAPPPPPTKAPPPPPAPEPVPQPPPPPPPEEPVVTPPPDEPIATPPPEEPVATPPPEEPVVQDTAMPIDLPSMMPSVAPSVMPTSIQSESPTGVTETVVPTSSGPTEDAQTSEPVGGVQTPEPTMSSQTQEPAGATQTAEPTSQSTSEPTTSPPAESIPTGVPGETVTPAPFTDQPVVTSPTPVPMTTEVALEGISTTYTNVDRLTQGEVAQLLKLTETWWNAYYPPGSSCNFKTIMEFVNQKVSFNSDGLPENLVVFNQRLFITTPDGGEIGFSTPGIEASTNGSEDTCPVQDASALPPEKIAVLPYEEFVANTQLGLIYRENIVSFTEVKIPLQIPVVPVGMPEVDTSGSKAFMSTGVAVTVLLIGLFV